MFLQYLWGIETFLILISLQGLRLVFTVPMRNWNYLFCTSFYILYNVFTVPMRNWNMTAPCEKLQKQLVFTVPMRNWNYILNPPFCETESVFTVPMRNWNYLFCTSFYILYNVFTVPMRNWNAEVTILWFRKKTLFLQYLWGIETAMQFPQLCRFWWVFTVPMRNWNMYKVADTLFATFVFTVPMRNWNRGSAQLLRTIEKSFYSTYEELKQTTFIIVVSYFMVFTVPMRNWNSMRACGLKRRAHVFTVPMRNWNRMFLFNTTQVSLRFYSTYEELKP